MTNFERTEGAQPNLGKEDGFVSLEDLAIDGGLTPDQALIQKEGEEGLGGEYDSESGDKDWGASTKRLSQEEISDKSNWEDGLEAGEFDGHYIKDEPVIPLDRSITFHGVERSNLSENGPMLDGDYKEFESHIPKKEKPGSDRASIRFDDVA